MLELIDKYLNKAVVVIEKRKKKWISGSGKYLPKICIHLFKRRKKSILYCKAFVGSKHFFIKKIENHPVKSQKGFSLKSFQDRELVKKTLLEYWEKRYYWVFSQAEEPIASEILENILKYYKGWFEVFVYKDKEELIKVAIRANLEDANLGSELGINKV